jgi:hypothetical protein
MFLQKQRLEKDVISTPRLKNQLRGKRSLFSVLKISFPHPLYRQTFLKGF